MGNQLSIAKKKQMMKYFRKTWNDIDIMIDCQVVWTAQRNENVTIDGDTLMFVY